MTRALGFGSAAFVAACAGVFAISPAKAAGEAKQLWELAGMATPESVLLDAKSKTLYVANINGDPMAKDGNGFIAKVSTDGKLINKDFVTGLNAPKGMAVVGDKLYTADVDEIVEITLADGKVSKKYPAAGAGLLNDVAADAKGNIYVSDTAKGGIYILSGGKVDKWLEAPELAGANGLLVEGGNMIVNTWGVMTGKGFETSSLGRVLSVSLADKKIAALDGGKPVGNLDGLQPAGDGSYLITDWKAGAVIKFGKDGKSTVVYDKLGPGGADLDYDPATKTMYIPQMLKNTLHAVQLP